jgi:predicted phosphodiesterase
MKYPKDLLTKEYLESRIHDTTQEIADSTGLNYTTIYYHRTQKKLEYQPVIADKLLIDRPNKKQVNFGSISEMAKGMLALRGVTESKQREARWHVPTEDKYIGVAIFGDLHFGDFYQDIDFLMDHTEKVLKAQNCYAIQVGDILNNQASLTHRKMNRESPYEFPLSLQRKMAKEWFQKISSKLLAFVIGNHDERPMVSEDLDIGESLVDVIEGAYLGYKGELEIVINDELVYRVYITHGGKGYSMWNPLHPAYRVFAKRPGLDVVAFGHIHAGVATGSIPLYDRVRGIGIRSSGYELMPEDVPQLSGIAPSHYGWKVGEEWNVPGTPLFILNPHKRKLLVFDELEDGLAHLEMLNNE